MSETEERLCAVLRDCFDALAAVADIVHASGNMDLYQTLNDAALRAQQSVRDAGGDVPFSRK